MDTDIFLTNIKIKYPTQSRKAAKGAEINMVMGLVRECPAIMDVFISTNIDRDSLT